MAFYVWFVVLLAISCQHGVLACTPTESMTLEEMVASADVVLLAEVIKHYDNTHIMGQAYTAEVKVHCILKAPEALVINSIHNISEAGVVDGRCYSVDLAVNMRYIVTGYVVAGHIKPFEDAIDATPENIMSVSQLCGLSPRLPTGIAASGATFCPSHVDSRGCIVTRGDHDGHDHDEHDHDGHDHDDHDHDGHDHDDHDHDDHDHDEHDHDEHDHDDHDDHDHDDHHDDHHSDDHGHHHDDHFHDDNEHDHDDDGTHDHADHHHGHDHDLDDHDHQDHHSDHEHEHDIDHQHQKAVASASVIGQALSIVLGFAVFHAL